jgi:uncharacterized metal-binding protein YceD (DUF177 family)
LTDDFAHRLRIDQVRDGQRLDLVAGEEECAAIAERLGLDSLDRLEAHVTLTRDGQSVRAEGRLGASLQQRCVITDEPVASHADEAFAFTFIPAPTATAHDEEIELGGDELDTIFYDGAVIDLGTAIADTLVLSIDPFPRSAGAEAALKEAGVMTEADASPFAVLARLRNNDET